MQQHALKRCLSYVIVPLPHSRNRFGYGGQCCELSWLYYMHVHLGVVMGQRQRILLEDWGMPLFLQKSTYDIFTCNTYLKFCNRKKTKSKLHLKEIYSLF